MVDINVIDIWRSWIELKDIFYNIGNIITAQL